MVDFEKIRIVDEGNMHMADAQLIAATRATMRVNEWDVAGLTKSLEAQYVCDHSK